MMTSKFGNYVVQRAFNMSDPDRQNILKQKIECVVRFGNINQDKPHAKHVLTFLRQKHGIRFDINPNQSEQQQQCLTPTNFNQS